MVSQDVSVSKRLPNEPEARHAVFPYDFPETTQESVEKYGESLTRKLICDSVTLMIQGPARKVLETAPPGLSNEEYSSFVSDHMRDHKIEIKRTRGVSAPKISAYESVARDLADPSKREAILEKFRSLGINLDMNGALSAGAEEEETEDSPEAPEVSRRRR